MERSSAPRIAMALVSVVFGIYFVSMIAAVQASLNVYASDMSGVLQLSALAVCALLAGLASLAFQVYDTLGMSILQLVLYALACLTAMAGLDSEVFLHRPVSMLHLALVWFAICAVFYALRVRVQWLRSGQEIVQARKERLYRAAERARKARGNDDEIPEWEDQTLPPPRL